LLYILSTLEALKIGRISKKCKPSRVLAGFRPGLLDVENEIGCNGQVREIALVNVGTEKTAASRQLGSDLIINPPEK